MIMFSITSKSVNVVSQLGELGLESFSLSDTQNEVSGFLIRQRKTLNDLPMVEDSLREGLSLSVSSKHTSETEGFRNRQVRFDLNK